MTGFDFFAIASRSAMPSAKDVEVRPARGAEVNAATEPAAKKRTASFMVKNKWEKRLDADVLPFVELEGYAGLESFDSDTRD